MSAIKFEKLLNCWLADNPYVTDLKLYMDVDSSPYSFLVSNRVYIRSASVEYRVDTKPQNYQYGCAFTYKCRPFGNWGYNYKKHFAKWYENNTDCAVISTHGTGKIRHWSTQGDNYVEYYSLIFFKKPITY